MKRRKSLLIVLFAVLMCNTIFAYSFQWKKHFTQSEYDNNSKEIEWYDEHDYPYCVDMEEEDDYGDYDIVYEYYNCDDEDDLIHKGDEIEKQLKKKKNSNSNNGTEKKSSQPQTQTVTETIDPNVFYGKRKEECPTEEILYKSVYYMKPIDSTKVGDINSASQYYYDDTKTAYFYPLKSESDYVSFQVLVQDGFSELQQAIFIVDQCEFKKDAQGNWVLVKAESQAKDANTFAKVNSDENMLIKMLNAKLKGYDSDKNVKSITYTCITSNMADNSSFSGIFKSTKAATDKIDYYKTHPTENPMTDGLDVHVFLTDYGKTVKSYLDMVYDALEAWNNGTGNGYVVESYFSTAKSLYSNLLDMAVNYKNIYGPNNVTYLCYKSDCGYLHNHFLTISKICGFRYP